MCEDSCEKSNNEICNDGGAGSDDSHCLIGTDCADCGARLREANDCYFENGGGSYKSLRAGNLYTLVVTFDSGVESWDDGPSNSHDDYEIEIRFFARYPDGDQLCLSRSMPLSSDATYFSAYMEMDPPNQISIEFPLEDLLSKQCSGATFKTDVSMKQPDEYVEGFFSSAWSSAQQMAAGDVLGGLSTAAEGYAPVNVDVGFDFLQNQPSEISNGNGSTC